MASLAEHGARPRDARRVQDAVISLPLVVHERRQHFRRLEPTPRHADIPAWRDGRQM